MRASIAAFLFVAFAISLPGCTASEEHPKYPVTGTVTYAGQPIETGTIVFDPVDGEGPSAMGGIENGVITAEVSAGEKIVRISAVRTLEKKDQYGAPITESYIPDKYNGTSDLRETITSDEKNELVIDLKK
ncbi:hypothetical protein Pan97_53640 [Bremerella volcania]|uniref:Uncharacterized protein n=1 Tax=Bremerella volcania TaxID=2527984 RepID=A0A518CGC5_9BACT|nr:hypothetical protein [Bremerella volcania]QDU78279.1 hypothetical protein Pan97_53640 [Bremerella volcania]